MRIVLGYVLAHEYAHHIFSHSPKNLAESRKNENEADDFAIRVNWALGNNPLLAVNYFLLFMIVENGIDNTNTHPPSACRLEKFLHAGVKFTEGEMKNRKVNPKFKAWLKQIETVRLTLKKQCEEGKALTETSIPGLFSK